MKSPLNNDLLSNHCSPPLELATAIGGMGRYVDQLTNQRKSI
jgi:hypothetical protein